jgi:signal peptidase II
LSMPIVMLAVFVVALDRVTKEIAMRTLADRRGVLRLVTVGRPLLPHGSRRALFGIWVVATACAVGAVLCAPPLRDNAFISAGLAIALAGAAGNLIDRFVRGAVVDFIAIGRWPAFNIADVAIVGGAAAVGTALMPPAFAGW